MPNIRCPYCKGINTTLTDGVRETLMGYRRRYKCLDCGYRYRTLEEWCPTPKPKSLIPNSQCTQRLATRSRSQIEKELYNGH